MPRVRLPNNFEPRSYQRRYMAYFDAGGKRAVWVVHRRGGKDLTALHQTCKMMHRRRGVYWHVYPTESQGRKAIWEGFTRNGDRIMEQAFPASIRRFPKEFLPKQEMLVELKCGSIWRLLGSDHIEVVGAGPVGVTFSEYAIAKPTAWDMIRPMLRENGGWASFISTPRGGNHFKKLFDLATPDRGWFRDLQTLHDTRAFEPGQTADQVLAEERAEGMPEGTLLQEYLCDWTAASPGSIWGDLLERLEFKGRFAEFEHPKDGVFTTWDLGISDSTAIWFWRLSKSGVDLIDCYENRGQPMDHYFNVVKGIVPIRPGHTADYQYVKHWLPHDARAKTLATGRSILDQCIEAWGSSMVGITPSLGLQDGIQATRWLLQRDVRFHPRCTEGLEALKEYHFEWDDDRHVLSSRPFHNWSSHYADAMRYCAVVVKVSKLLLPDAKQDKSPDADNRTYDLETLFKEREAGLTRRERIE